MSNQVSYGNPNDAQPTQAAPSTVSEPQEAKQPEYITREEAQRLVAEAAEQALRKAQSLNDKAQSKVNARLDEILKSYSSLTGQQPDQAMKDKALELARSQVQEPAQASADPAGEIERKTDELYKKHGLYVEENDPEAKGIDHSSPERFLLTLETALVTKASRTKTAPAAIQEQPANLAALPALGATGVQVNPIQNINNPAELLRIGLSGKK